MMVLTGGSVLLESRPDDISIDMNQLSQRHQQQQQFFDEQVTQHFMSDITTAIYTLLYRTTISNKEQRLWKI